MGYTMRLIPMIVAGVIATAANAGDRPPTNAELLARIEKLEARIAAMEAKGATSSSGTVGAIPDADDDSRVMRVIRIDTLPQDDAGIAEAKQLDAEADKLEKDATKAMPKESDKGKDREKANRLAAKLTDDAKAKRVEATTVRRKATIHRHRLVGWNGSRFVVLVTSRDLTSAVTRLAPGNFIGWSGDRIKLTNRVEEYEVRTIGVEDSPVNYVDPPPDAKLP